MAKAEPASRHGAGPRDIARILRDFRFNEYNMEHVIILTQISFRYSHFRNLILGTIADIMDLYNYVYGS